MLMTTDDKAESARDEANEEITGIFIRRFLYMCNTIQYNTIQYNTVSQIKPCYRPNTIFRKRLIFG